MNESQNSAPPEGASDAGGLAAFIAEAERSSLRDMLTRLQRAPIALQAGGVPEALAWAASHVLPDVLLVDLSAEAHPLQAMAELAAAYGPDTHIIVLGETQDIDLYRQLLQAGALDYLLKPLSLGLLASTLERAASDLPLGQGGQMRGGRTVAIVGAGGGAGTSTIVAGLGRLIAGPCQTPCVLVDFDRRKGDLPLLLGAEAGGGLAALLAANEIDRRLLQRSVSSLPAALSAGVPQRLHLLAQSPDSYTPVDAERVLELGGALSQLFSISLWDMPAARSEGVAEVLDHADVRVLLFDLNVQSARHVHRLVQRFGDERLGQRLLLVRNPTRPLTPKRSMTTAQFEDFIGRRIDLSLPYAGNSLADSLLNGPLEIGADPTFSQDLLALAHRLLGRKPKNVARPLPVSWLHRLRRGVAAQRHSYS